MLNSPLIDVVLGMCFVFLFMSLISTALNETLASLFSWRAANLKTALTNMLSEEGVEKLYAQPLIANLSINGKPSYIPSKTFAKAAAMAFTSISVNTDLKTLQGDIQKIPNQKAQAFLLQHLNAAEGNTEKFQKNLEDAFNDSMDRASGWYKRTIQYWTLGFAVFIAMFLNVDSFHLAQKLYSNAGLRSSMSALAVAASEKNPTDSTQPTGAARLDKLSNEAENLQLPIGDWSDWNGLTAYGYISKFFGWLITALAISLGAPFWFDTLNRIIQIRGSGKNPSEPDAKPAK